MTNYFVIGDVHGKAKMLKELLKKWGVTGDYEGIGHCVLGYALPGCTAECRPRKENYVYNV